MRFACIDGEKAISITRQCRLLGVSPSGFYAWRSRPESRHAQADRRLRVLVQTSFEESRRRHGSPRIHADLTEQSIRVSRKRVVRLMQADGPVARAIPPRVPRAPTSTVGGPWTGDNSLALPIGSLQKDSRVPSPRWRAGLCEAEGAGSA
jgi:hypothetical protein